VLYLLGHTYETMGKREVTPLALLLWRRGQVRGRSLRSRSLSRNPAPHQAFQTRAINTVNKRTFLKLLSTLMTVPVVSPVLAWALGEKLKNWAGNIEYRGKLFTMSPATLRAQYPKGKFRNEFLDRNIFAPAS